MLYFAVLFGCGKVLSRFVICGKAEVMCCIVIAGCGGV